MVARRTSVVLKLLNGSAEQNPGRMRDDTKVAPKDPKPLLPPWEKLSVDERRVYDFICKEFVLPMVHGRPDGLMIVALAKQIVQRDRALEKLKEYGPVMKAPKTGKPVLQPYFQAYKVHDEAVRKLMFECGFSPLGRLKHAPPMGAVPGGPTDWDDIK